MKPLNNEETGCIKTSSNCIIWDGDPIECIHLCKGDTVTDVVYKLATEFCNVMDILKITNYNHDLECFHLGTQTPEDFEAMIQFILQQLCTVSTVTDVLNTRSLNAPTDCCTQIVDIATCFQYTDPRTGDTITQMNFIDYALAIGTKVCDIVNQIITINLTLSNHETRITTLENKPAPTFVMPQSIAVCSMTPGLQDVNVLLTALESAFCTLRGATGQTTDIFTGIGLQPGGLAAETKLGGSGTMGSIAGWSNPVLNEGESVGNLWLTIMDLRAAVRNIQINCCPSGCGDVRLELYASINGTLLTINITGTVPTGFTECNVLGTSFTITDTYGNSTMVTFPIISYLNGPGYTMDLAGTPVNVVTNLTISATPCLTNPTTGATCEFCTTYTLVNTASCPELILTSTQTSINFTFSTTVGLKVYTVELWSNDYSTEITNQIFTSSIIQTITGSFAGLTAGTPYKVRVTVTPTGVQVPTECPFITISTTPETCPLPTDVIARIEISH